MNMMNMADMMNAAHVTIKEDMMKKGPMGPMDSKKDKMENSKMGENKPSVSNKGK